jgi:prepilin-type processing-associated H-X9-DG protein
VQTPIKFFNCPSRRPAKLYQIPIANDVFFNFEPVGLGAKVDYSANAGDQPPPNDDQNGNGGKPPAPPPAVPAQFRFTGVVYQRSTVRLAEITDGTSNTLMVGEKHVSVQNYLTGLDQADNENIYVGFDNDTTRSMNNRRTGAVGDIRFPPRVDSRVADLRVFGSAHPGGFNGVLCDGSVRNFSYTSTKTSTCVSATVATELSLGSLSIKCASKYDLAGGASGIGRRGAVLGFDANRSAGPRR